MLAPPLERLALAVVCLVVVVVCGQLDWVLAGRRGGGQRDEAVLGCVATGHGGGGAGAAVASAAA
ncbi:hypothetical protein DFJ73DRAFT_809160, partial [Zopfochytrium polystomum]